MLIPAFAVAALLLACWALGGEIWESREQILEWMSSHRLATGMIFCLWGFVVSCWLALLGPDY